MYIPCIVNKILFYKNNSVLPKSQAIEKLCLRRYIK